MIETFTVEESGMRSLATGAFVAIDIEPGDGWAPVSHGSQINASNTGVPVGTSLSVYSGPMTITVNGTVIEGRIINGDLQIQAKNVVVRKCQLNGFIDIDEGEVDGAYNFLIEDTRVNTGNRAVTAVGSKDFIARRCHITGGNRSVYCYHNAVVEECYILGQWVSSAVRTHASGLRISQTSSIQRNSITCDVKDVPVMGGNPMTDVSGPSANMTGYGDFETVEHIDVINNYFGATDGGFGCYGGSSAGKPYPNANNIRYMGNRWARGASGRNGVWGPITDFNSSSPGNVWSNNAYTDGTFFTSDGVEL